MSGKITALLLSSAMLLTLCACSGEKESSGESSVGMKAESSQIGETSHEVSDSALSYTVKDAETPSASSSSLTSPLETGQWGTAAKLSLKDQTYVNVPVRIVSVRRGSAVNEEVKTKMKASSFNYYMEPADYEEYVIAEYEICLDGFPVKEGGTLCDVVAFVTGTDGQAIKLKNGSYWSSTASCLDNDTYFYEGTIHSVMAYRIPKECSEYLLTLGEYGETQAFVKLN